VQPVVPAAVRTLAAVAATLALVLAGVAGVAVPGPVGVAAAVPDARLTVSDVAVTPARASAS